MGGSKFGMACLVEYILLYGRSVRSRVKSSTVAVVEL